MKKILKKLAFASVLVLALAGVAAAYTYPVSVGQQITIGDGVGGSVSGGEFVVEKLSGAALFNTFCLETNEYIYTGGIFTVDSILDEAIKGGTNTQAGDPLSDQTRWLYWHFFIGDLNTKVAGYSYNDGTSADALQVAIWMLEGETNWTYPANPLKAAAIAALASQLIDAANFAVSHNSFGGPVMALNLKNQWGQDAQSLLIAAVPEPGTIVLLGAGLLGLGFLGRRRMKM